MPSWGYVTGDELRSCLGFLLLVLCVILPGCNNRHPTSTSKESSSRAPQGALELVSPYGSEKEKWINDVSAVFNQAGNKSKSGKAIFVRALPMGSDESIDVIGKAEVQSGRLMLAA